MLHDTPDASALPVVGPALQLVAALLYSSLMLRDSFTHGAGSSGVTGGVGGSLGMSLTATVWC
jgi:hypothetical protein